MLTKSFQKCRVGCGLALGLLHPVYLAGFRKGVAHCCNQAAANQIRDFFRFRFDLRQLSGQGNVFVHLHDVQIGGQRTRILRGVVLGNFQQTDVGRIQNFIL